MVANTVSACCCSFYFILHPDISLMLLLMFCFLFLVNNRIDKIHAEWIKSTINLLKYAFNGTTTTSPVRIPIHIPHFQQLINHIFGFYELTHKCTRKFFYIYAIILKPNNCLNILLLKQTISVTYKYSCVCSFFLQIW